jgi:hypothetical protein
MSAIVGLFRQIDFWDLLARYLLTAQGGNRRFPVEAKTAGGKPIITHRPFALPTKPYTGFKIAPRCLKVNTAF